MTERASVFVSVIVSETLGTLLMDIFEHPIQSTATQCSNHSDIDEHIDILHIASIEKNLGKVYNPKCFSNMKQSTKFGQI